MSIAQSVGNLFQSHAGSIEARCGARFRATGSGFQSHAGSIEATLNIDDHPVVDLGFNPTLVRLRRSWRRRPGWRWPRFQSHAGSIEAALIGNIICIGSLCFNPTLVRLRPLPRGGICFNLTRFQSHAGSIEASHKVDKKPSIHSVSIPRWFD